MKNSKKSNSVFLLLIIFLGACQSTRSFEMSTREKEELYVVEIDSNRIVQECYFMNAEKENNWRHQYSLNMLNERNEVISAFYPTNQDKEYCLAHLKKVEKMIDDTSDPEFHDFRALGKHESPYYALTFDTICNSKECFSISDTWTYTLSWIWKIGKQLC